MQFEVSPVPNAGSEGVDETPFSATKDGSRAEIVNGHYERLEELCRARIRTSRDSGAWHIQGRETASKMLLGEV